MRTLTILTLTDRYKKQGDYVRMDNIIRRLENRIPVEVIGLSGYSEEEMKKWGKYPYFLAKETARLGLAWRSLFLSGRRVFYTWDWILARNLACLSYGRRIDFVMEVNGLHSYESEIRGYFKHGGFWNRNYIRRGERWVCRRARRIVAVSEGLKRTLESSYGVDPEKVVVAPNGADIEKFPYTPPPGDAKDPLVVGWVGSFQPYEGFGTFLELAKEYQKEGRSVRFLIVGEGPGKAGYEAEVKKENLEALFDFRGKLEWESIPETLAPAHLCVMVPELEGPGREYREALGMTQMKFYEYLALGKPVVTYRLGDAESVIDKNGVGRTCEPTLYSLKETILEVGAGEDSEKMSLAARRLAETEYTWGKTVDKILEGLEGLLRED